jgi:hypothetical protein
MLKNRLGRLLMLCLMCLAFLIGCEEMDQARLVYADGSGNVYRVSKNPEPRIVYQPLKPAESSTGLYDGGEPVDRQITEAAYFEILKAVTAAYENKAAQIEDRIKTSGAVSIITQDKEISFILKPGSTELLTLEQLLKASLKASP